MELEYFWSSLIWDSSYFLAHSISRVLEGYLLIIYDPTVNSLFVTTSSTRSLVEVEVGVSGNCSKLAYICKRAFGIRIVADKKKKKKPWIPVTFIVDAYAYTKYTLYIYACRYIIRQEFALPQSSSPFPNIGNLYSIVETSETWHLHPQGVPSIITAPTPYFCIS